MQLSLTSSAVNDVDSIAALMWVDVLTGHLSSSDDDEVVGRLPLVDVV